MADADYADILALLENKPNQVESLLHSLQQAAKSIGHFVNANKIDYKYFKRKGGI